MSNEEMSNEQPEDAQRPTHERLVKRIRTMLDDSPGCMCGFRESCEVCNPYSEYNKLRDRLIAEIDGPEQAPDYGAVIQIDVTDISGA